MNGDDKKNGMCVMESCSSKARSALEGKNEFFNCAFCGATQKLLFQVFAHKLKLNFFS